MALVLKINDFDRSEWTLWKSINLNQNLTYQVDTLKFTIQSYPGHPFTPHVLDEVKFERDGTVIFGGTIVNIEEGVRAVDRITYKVTCKDFSHLFDRRLVAKTYTEKPLINIVSDILNRFVNRGDRLEIATMEPNEIWTGDSTVDTTNFRTDEQSRKLTSTNNVLVSMNRKIFVNMNQEQLKGLGTPIDNVSVPDAATLQNLFDSGGTFTCWIRPESDGLLNTGAVAVKGLSADPRWRINVLGESSGFVKLAFFHAFSGVDGTWETSTAVVPLNDWSHIAVVYDNDLAGNDPTIYLNGVAQTITETSSPTGTRTSDIGANLFFGNSIDEDVTFDGQIDEIKLYASALVASAILVDFRNPGAAGTAVAQWKFNEATGLTAFDSVGSNNGTLEGATFFQGFEGNCVDFSSSDYIDIDAFVDTAANIDTVTMKLGDDGLVNYFSLDITSDLSADGWNWVHRLRSDFSETGSPNWETGIKEVQLEVTSTTGTTVNISFDNWQQVRRNAFTRQNSAAALQVVQYFSFNYEQPTKAIRQLVNLFEWQWYIDENKDLHIFKRFDKLSPFNLTDTNGNYVYNSLKVKDKADQLRNSIIVRGGDFISTEITDDLSQQSDGVNKIFLLGFGYSDFSMTVNGDDQSIGVDSLDTFSDTESVAQKTTGDEIQLGDAAARTHQAQQIISTRKGRFQKLSLRIRAVGSPSDDLKIQVFSDDGSNAPSGTSLSTETTISNGLLSTTFQEITVTFTESSTNSLLFNADDKFHVRIKRDGAVDGSNYYEIDGADGVVYDGRANVGDAVPNWTEQSFDWFFIEFLQFDVLYSFSEKVALFETAPAAPDTVVWTGKPHIPVIIQLKEATSINEFGEFQFLIIDKSIQNKPAARQRATQEILAWAQKVSEGSFITRTDGLRAGQTITVQSTIRGISEDFLIRRVRAKARKSDALNYQITLVTTKTMGILYWMQKQLEKETKQVVIDIPEEIDRIETVLETLLFTDTSVVTTLYDGKVWSNDAGTTPDRLIWDGGAEHIWV